ncbi:hypothetical protein ACJX0J_021263, partial [Zea mays]
REVTSHLKIILVPGISSPRQMGGAQAQVTASILRVLQQWLPCPLPLIHRQNPAAHRHNLIQAKGLKEPLLLQRYPVLYQGKNFLCIPE